MASTRIHEDIFRDYPTFRRGIVVASNLENSTHSEKLRKILDKAVEGASADPIDLKTDPRTADWNEAHRRFGSNPNKFPPAHCALLKRVQKPGASLPFINMVVAVMNYNSVAGITPVGGDDLAAAGQVLELRYAKGTETFIPLGTPEKPEHPEPGEVIYVAEDFQEVMCRRWNWRNGHTTRITEETRALVMNIDGLGADSEARTVLIRDRVAEMLAEYCKAEVATAMLSPSQGVFDFSL